MDIGKDSDQRPKRGAWAPGDYWHRECSGCKQSFTGDKRAMECADCAYSAKPELRVRGYVNGQPVPDDVIRALWPSRKMTLAESLTHMMVEYIDGARRLPTSIQIDRESLLPIFEKRLARYISADKIAMIISEDASLQNGSLNVGYLAVKIAETIEGKRNAT